MQKGLPLSSAEAAKLIGCSVSTVSRLVTKGELTPVMRLADGAGGAMFFDRADVEAYAATRKAS